MNKQKLERLADRCAENYYHASQTQGDCDAVKEAYKSGYLACESRMLKRIDPIIKELTLRSLRSQYSWSEGGQYSNQDWINEGMIACALAVFNICDKSLKEDGNE